MKGLWAKILEDQPVIHTTKGERETHAILAKGRSETKGRVNVDLRPTRRGRGPTVLVKGGIWWEGVMVVRLVGRGVLVGGLQAGDSHVSSFKLSRHVCLENLVSVAAARVGFCVGLCWPSWWLSGLVLVFSDWENPHRIYERLDKGFASNDWLSLFPNTFIKHFPIQISDHAPIILDTNMVLNTKKKVYMLEAWCFDHAECSDLVKESWERKYKGDAPHVLESYLLDIEKGGDTLNYESCHKKLMEFSIAAGTYWRQRTKLKWNCEGDTCTKYFFNWSDSEPECFEDYLNKYGYLFDNLRRKVGMEKRAKLGRAYSKNEVRGAVFQLRPLKSPGPDGIPAAFYQRYWSIVKNDVIKGALNILNSGSVLKDFNKTFIVLIPKNDCPERVGDFGPISLCNVIMKVVTKCIANRLKGVMDDLVSPFQCDFVSNRSIADNIVIAQEILHVINHRSYGKKGMMALKADMSKAYDRLNCNFIRGVLSYPNLPGSMVHLIMNTIESVSYEILMNGSPMEKVEPCCGIRQGDTLSPYIFVLCTEVLSKMILYAQDVNLIKGIKICKNGPEISHLLFADHSLFFLRGDYGDLDFLVNVIDEYCVASGQCLNKDKSSILFSLNCSLMAVQKCLTEFKFTPKHDLGNYLGLPTSIGSSKRDLFKFLVDKTKRRFSSWNNILLSSAGKLTLIRYVLSSLSLFSLSVFRIPCSKEFLSRLVGEGGLGLRNIGCFNQALLTKPAWRILRVPGSLISKVIGPKLGVPEDLLFQNRWKAPQASSWALKSLVWGSDLIYNNIAWTIGSSSRLNAWKSKWIEGFSLHDLCGDSINAPTDSTLLVGDLHDNHQRWDLYSLGFDPGEEVTKKILATYIPCQPSDDSFYWKFSKHGVFTVKSGYYAVTMALSNGPTSNTNRSRMSATIMTFCKSKLWKLSISNKLRVFLWKFMANALPVGSEFLKRKLNWRSSCTLSDESSPCVESISHLFRDCSFAKAMWFGCPLGLRITGRVGH
ncbi:uncharacterized protein LOC141600687 [Silene latifolia]|uniref:uncharacterized protein LOC141600687 n=1 Tax=Silene latifolia TaxID=37657 RepID=UPI003D778523